MWSTTQTGDVDAAMLTSLVRRDVLLQTTWNPIQSVSAASCTPRWGKKSSFSEKNIIQLGSRFVLIWNVVENHTYWLRYAALIEGSTKRLRSHAKNSKASRSMNRRTSGIDTTAGAGFRSRNPTISGAFPGGIRDSHDHGIIILATFVLL